MAIGTMEGIIIGSVILLGVVFFGRNWIKRAAAMVFGAKQDIDEVKESFKTKSVKN